MQLDVTNWPWWVQMLLNDPVKFQAFQILGMALAGIFLVYFLKTFFDMFFNHHDKGGK